MARQDDGTTIPVYFKAFAVRDEQGSTVALATITRDIALQKQADDELRRIAADLSEADRRKSEFLATLAHELRNPLAPVRTGLDVLRQARGDMAGATKVLDMMDRQLGHLVHLVNDLLDVARITRGKIELKKSQTDVHAVVAMALETSMALVESHGRALTVQLDAAPMPIFVDATRLVQVINNLLNNAAKYTPRGGSITLSARREDQQAVLEVQDSGVGIAAESLGTLFDLFTQVGRHLERSQGGLGIGLSLVQRLVELHGGTVSAHSAGPDQGSRFVVRLPLAAESLAALLELLGHQTRVALEGEHGLVLACEFAPDLAFLDIGLPVMDGHDLARAIRSRAVGAHMTLVALTGWGTHADLVQSEHAGFDLHLTKPVDIAQLQSVVAKVERRRQ
jgi:signal transduction histidine kinase